MTRYVQEQTCVNGGVSGTTFGRPGQNAMISDVRAGKISPVIVKDLNRFGRDYIGTGKFIDVIFPSDADSEQDGYELRRKHKCLTAKRKKPLAAKKSGF